MSADTLTVIQGQLETVAAQLSSCQVEQVITENEISELHAKLDEQRQREKKLRRDEESLLAALKIHERPEWDK